ncbi:hypothetical protein NE237_021592 [Protea cynaroides]|uniref:CAAX prenyl protease 2/Lysostaphin resistance protein A-like domain-containing protein n=1 Tax=Protea cynaroides TaxID=273540 RepID=A0A9Q0K3N9_9MAGN|nr:hypothetical protein NE237_021592 [Protea cynaroides]
MASSVTSLALVVRSPRCSYSCSSKLSASKALWKPNHPFVHKRDSSFSLPFSLAKSSGVLEFSNKKINTLAERGLYSICYCNPKEEPNDSFQGKDIGLDWPILRRWDVPWQWQTVSLTMFACVISFVLTGLVETTVLPYLGLQIGELSLDEKAELLFVDQAYASVPLVLSCTLTAGALLAMIATGWIIRQYTSSMFYMWQENLWLIVTAIVLGVIYGFTNTFQPLPDDIFCYELKDPFNLQKGWLLWAGFGFVGALLSVALTGAAMALFSGKSPQRETDALVHLLPLIGSSNISTGCLVGITGVLAPLLEETVFRGFLMVSLTQWFPTPVSVLLSAVVFSIAHLTPGEFPQLFVLGTALGFSYAQTRNLLTPITIHALWNSGVILVLTFLQLQGYDIRELLQAY